MKIIEIEKHRRALSICEQKIVKLAERVRPDRVAIVRNQQPAIGALACEHVEVVGPKINHYFLQLPLAVHRAKYPRHLQLASKELRRTQIVLFEVSHHRLAILRIIQWILIRCRISGLRIRIHIRIRCPLHFAADHVACLRCVRVGRVRATLHAIVAGRCQFCRQCTAALKLLQQLARLRIFFVKFRRRHTQRC